ncbi:ribbon-helix-helix domain-containing protein [Albimonas sp. CAU 1670]|uniref:ribbon-helix-helix domain-containing protein n=1 Tax=Albimonas sp. CAU 1670 TaxID=3032599 RepID=UPI0023DBD8EE|nr:ribbon-helix-helix domain-containing protein [Albimonas sp. CAU 1670]MDF2233061.1 ribbon-helix-helix domain-containing protein [Albimonas sp. CAU 1670]
MSAASLSSTAASPAPYAAPEKRSLTLRGHRSSVTLEPEFWEAFRALAARRGQALNALAAEIDATRPPEVGLACALRTFVLRQAIAGALSSEPDAPDTHAEGPR